jgi:hypothetical protein
MAQEEFAQEGQEHATAARSADGHSHWKGHTKAANQTGTAG